MLVHIANYLEADRRTAVAGEDLALGAIVKVISEDSSGNRKVARVATNADLASGNIAFAFKVSSDPLQVTTSTVPSEMGTRIVTIKSNDFIVAARKGTIMEYDPSALHQSLDPSRGGTLPSAGQDIAILPATGLPCAVGTGTALTTIVLRCYNKVNGKVRIELV